MAFDGAGNYTLPSPEFPAVSGEYILAATYNTILSDIASALSLVLVRDGQAPMAANLNLASHKITNLLAGTADTDAVTVAQVLTAAITALKALTPAADRMIYFSDPTTAALLATTSFGRSLLNLADAAALLAAAGAEPADATILKDADIGVTVQAYDATILNAAAIGVTVQAYDATLLTTAAIGVTVQPYSATTDAEDVTYDNTTSGLTATTAQDALDEVVEDLATVVAGLGSTVMPIGSIFLARDGSLCDGVLECAGAAVSRTTYRNLFSGSGMFPFDLTAAQFLDEKGNITTLTVDTANTSGHFDVAKSARIVAGCRIVIAGTSYSIVSISGDGTASNSVVFSGTLTTGAKTVSSIYGCTLDGTALRLSQGAVQNTTDKCTGGTASESSHDGSHPGSNAFDADLVNTAWLTSSGTTTGWLGYAMAAAIRPWRFGIYHYAYFPNAPKDFSLQGYNGSSWVDLASFTNQTWSASDWKYFDIPAESRADYQSFRLNVTAVNGGSYICVYKLVIYDETVAYPASTVYPLALSVDCTDWTALKALTRTETLNSQNIWYALSFDGGTTYSAFVGSAWLPIVRNNAGTWEYWTGSAWAAASINSALGAMIQAAGVSGNRMTGADMAGLSQAQIEGSGGFTLGQTNLPMLVALYSASSTATPVLSEVKTITDPSVPSMPIGTTFGSGDGSTTFNLPDLAADAPTGMMYVISYQ